MLFLSKMPIKKHIIVITLVMVLLPLLICGGAAMILNYNTTMNAVSSNMAEMAVLTADRIKWELDSFLAVTRGTGFNIEIASASVSNETKTKILEEKASQYGMIRGGLISADGISIIDGKDYSDRGYFQEAMKGNTCISEPLISKITGELTIIIAAPVWENGVFGTTPVGCVYFVPNEEFLNDIMREIKLSEHSAAYMIDKDGNTIADVDSDVVKNGENIEVLAEENSSGEGGYVTLAKAHEKMRNGETGFSEYTLGGVRKFIGYAPVSNTNGWSVAIYAPADDFLSEAYLTLIITLILIVVAAIISIFSATLAGKSIGDPIKLCTERLVKLAHGDLTSPVPVIKAQDETGILARTTQTLVNDFNRIIGDMDNVLTSMADGNFDIKSENTDEIYAGDFHKLRDSVDIITARLSNTLRQINVSADQVSSGADQVSCGAQALSQGATEQAASIEELAATITSISDMINRNAKDAENAITMTQEAGGKMTEANKKMDGLVNAMTVISDSSAKIKNIIKTIEDIAFQTNILALNAAIEAARAGEAGKGFAVVADEVRNLAAKSAEAAQNTTNLIEGTVQAINNGSALVGEAADVMNQVSEAAENVAELNDKISEASKEAANSITQVTVGVDQISSVVQTNSATAEQSAAAAEELSSQAQMLDTLVSEFKLKDE
ncbi:MAG: methyl-accepting chemotaxis protein [Ruminiclostridium sp.]